MEQQAIIIGPLTEAAKNAFLVAEYRKAVAALCSSPGIAHLVRWTPAVANFIKRAVEIEKAVR